MARTLATFHSWDGSWGECWVVDFRRGISNGEGKILNFRLFSKKHNLYTNSLSWPSNQRTWSEWSITPNGQVLELILFEDGGSSFAHYKSGFEIEPWTGYFDSAGKKIYRGDILGALNHKDELDASYQAEVTWEEGGFYCKEDAQKSMPLEMDNKVWKRHIILGNIHGVEFSDANNL